MFETTLENNFAWLQILKAVNNPTTIDMKKVQAYIHSEAEIPIKKAEQVEFSKEIPYTLGSGPSSYIPIVQIILTSCHPILFVMPKPA